MTTAPPLLELQSSGSLATRLSSKLLLQLLLTASLALGVLATAQAQYGSAFYLGANAGMNASKFRFTEDLLELYPTSNRLPGVNVGLDAGFQLGHWSFASGFGYVQKGGRYESGTFTGDEGATGVFSARERLHYLTVPVNIGYSAMLTNRIGYKIAVGPSFNFGITGRIDETTEYFGQDFPEVQNRKVEFGSGVNDDYRGTQIGFQMQPSLFFDLSRNHRLTLNANFDLGTADAFNPRYRQANDFFRAYKGEVTNRLAGITIGYQYRLPFADRY